MVWLEEVAKQDNDKHLLFLKKLKVAVELKKNAKNEKYKAEMDSCQKDLTLLLSDKILLKIFALIPDNSHPISLVCTRWLRLQGLLWRNIRLKKWDFLTLGHMTTRFPSLTHVDLTAACTSASNGQPSVILSHGRSFSVSLSNGGSNYGEWALSKEEILKGLAILAAGCPALQKIRMVDVDGDDTEDGMGSALECVVKSCPMLQDIEIHRCNDESLRAVSGCSNLQVLRVICCVRGLYQSSVTDIGLTFLARNCSKLRKIELSGCQGSYDSIAAIGHCCPWVEELTLSNHEIEDGWTAALSSYSALKVLKLQSCKKIDGDPGPLEHIGCSSSLEKLHLSLCYMRDGKGFNALMKVCQNILEIEFHDCWGLDNDIFNLVSSCSKVKQLAVRGCSLLSIAGLEAVIISLNNLEKLHVLSCKKMKDADMSQCLARLFCDLKELKWCPNSVSVLSACLTGTGMGRKGGTFYKGI